MEYKIRVFITNGVATLPSNIVELYKSVRLTFNESEAIDLLDGIGVDTTINV